MKDICIDKEFIDLNSCILKSGLYVISGKKNFGQMELAVTLARFSGSAIYYEKIEYDDLSNIFRMVIKREKLQRGVVIFDLTFKRARALNTSLLSKLNNIAKSYDVKVFICNYEKIKNIESVLQSLSGVIEGKCISERRTMKLKVWNTDCKRFKLRTDKINIPRTAETEFFETFIIKCFNYWANQNGMIDVCYYDILKNRDVNNLLLFLNNKTCKKYELQTETHLIKSIESIHEFWQTTFEFGNDLDEYVYGLSANRERTLLYLCDAKDPIRKIAAVGICDGEVRDVIYHDYQYAKEEVSLCIMEYVNNTGVQVSNKCRWAVSKCGL